MKNEKNNKNCDINYLIFTSRQSSFVHLYVCIAAQAGLSRPGFRRMLLSCTASIVNRRFLVRERHHAHVDIRGAPRAGALRLRRAHARRHGARGRHRVQAHYTRLAHPEGLRARANRGPRTHGGRVRHLGRAHTSRTRTAALSARAPKAHRIS